MKRLLALVATALVLSGCQVLRPESALEGPRIGKPRIVITAQGILVVDQEPVLLGGRRSVTWTLPKGTDTYSDFGVVINTGVKQAVREGGVVRYVPKQGRKLDLPLSCKPIDAYQFTCDFTPALLAALEKDTLYTYTLSFKRNGVTYILDPTIMPDG